MIPTWSRHAVAVLAALTVAACGGGGSSPPPPDLILRGTVPAAAGTPVELLRLDASGTPTGTPLAATAVTFGRFEFNLTDLGVQPGADLAVRAVPASGPPLRALAAATSVDVGAGTEACVRWLLQAIAASPGASLAGLTATEAFGIQASAYALGLLDAAAGSPTEGAIEALRGRLAASTRFGDALAMALDPATALAGPGDLLDLVPLVAGNRWVYSSNQAPASQRFTSDVRGTVDPNRFEIVTDGSTESYVRLPDGVFTANAGLAAGLDDEIATLIGELPVVDFPPVPGRERTVRSGRGLALSDQDGDGRPESLDFSVVRREGGVVTTTLALADGAAARGLSIQDTVTVTVRVSTGSTLSVTAVGLTTFVPGIGPAWESITATAVLDGIPILGESETQQLTAWFKAPAEVSLVHRGVTYDPARGVAYATIPADGPPSLANRVVTIDLATRTVTTASPPLGTGAEPELVTLAGDGQSVFVSLAGTAQIAQLGLPSLSPVQPPFPLNAAGDVNTPWRATSLATTPQRPDVLAVSLAGPFGEAQGVGLYRAGQRLPDRAGCAFGTSGTTCRIGFGADGRLFAVDDNTSRNTLTRWFVDATSGATLELSANAPDLASPAPAGTRAGLGALEPGWVSGALLTPAGEFYDAGTLLRLAASPPNATSCIALSRPASFACRDTLLAGEFGLSELLADLATQRTLGAFRAGELKSTRARLIDLGRGRIGVSDAASDAATAFDRLLVIEGGPY
jgi:hypothetical protein